MAPDLGQLPGDMPQLVGEAVDRRDHFLGLAILGGQRRKGHDHVLQRASDRVLLARPSHQAVQQFDDLVVGHQGVQRAGGVLDALLQAFLHRFADQSDRQQIAGRRHRLGGEGDGLTVYPGGPGEFRRRRSGQARNSRLLRGQQAGKRTCDVGGETHIGSLTQTVWL